MHELGVSVPVHRQCRTFDEAGSGRWERLKISERERNTEIVSKCRPGLKW
jgi:hypothetical protein